MDYEPNRVKGIVPKVYGGLGNQLFIISAAYCTSKALGCPLYLPKNPKNHMNAHNTGIDYYETILKGIGIHLDESEEIVLQKLKAYDYFNHEGFFSWNPNTIRPGTVLNSYFQFYPALEPFEQTLQSLFLQNLPMVSVPENTGFLHVRRGDYLNHPNFHFIQPISYYTEALYELMMKTNNTIKKIYIFSDDIEWIKSQTFFQQDLFHIVEEKDELVSLALMTQCNAGAICANSTFSWWGAFLGAHVKRNPVIVPNRWIASQVESLFPEEWIVL
jgi:hypothetical protein